jgi:bifunctional DNA-binding transcriptional regulator/antitoxin component of YhaV-PrlF toxin-antitoxin module
MSKKPFPLSTGQVGLRGTIVLPAATRQRYGLDDGSLYISEEREDGVLIRPAKVVPKDLKDVRKKIQEGLDALKSGQSIGGAEAYAKLKRKSVEFRSRK